MDIREYKMFIESLGARYHEFEVLAASPECLSAKAKLVSRYYHNSSIKTLGDYQSHIPLLGLLTDSVSIGIVFDYDKLGDIAIRWKRFINNILDAGEWHYDTCTPDTILAKCEEILADASL